MTRNCLEQNLLLHEQQETKPLLCTDFLNLTVYATSNENFRDSNHWLGYFACSWSRAAEAYYHPEILKVAILRSISI